MEDSDKAALARANAKIAELERELESEREFLDELALAYEALQGELERAGSAAGSLTGARRPVLPAGTAAPPSPAPDGFAPEHADRPAPKRAGGPGPERSDGLAPERAGRPGQGSEDGWGVPLEAFPVKAPEPEPHEARADSARTEGPALQRLRRLSRRRP
ncbi:MAG TPA: hypothetical protein VEQ61_05940 [Thermoleophilaceae bacterium]|nr:hypothetical protein [Thermoleophilaceae bacterium]